MSEDSALYERETGLDEPDPEATRIRDRRVYTQPYDLVVQSLLDQIANGTIFLQPLSERPGFQRRYVWSNVLASRLIESILLNVPIPPCYLSQNSEYELDVIDGQQRLMSIWRFMDNQFSLVGLEVYQEFNGCRFHKLPSNIQRKLKTHTLRLIAVTNESHPDVKFDVFQRLNTNTVPLNAQELRNCMFRGELNELLKDVVTYRPWLDVLRKKSPDKRMRDEELALRFFSFYVRGPESYTTPQKGWLNETASEGMHYPREMIEDLHQAWMRAIDVSLTWFNPDECFRRNQTTKPLPINRALFDLVMLTAATTDPSLAHSRRRQVREAYSRLLSDDEFNDLISRAVDHASRTARRFQIWDSELSRALR